MSTIYTCQGKNCPLTDERSGTAYPRSTGLAIIPFKAPRWTLTMKPDINTDDTKVTAAHLCEACREAIRSEMLEV